jgi:acyl carrier protein
MTDTVAQKIIAIIAKTKKVPPESITIEASLEELKIDSLDGLNLFLDLEEAFNVTIPDDQARKMKTVREVVEGMEQLIAAGSTPSPQP